MEQEEMFRVRFRGSDLIKATSKGEAQEKTIDKFNDLGFPMAMFVVEEVELYKE